MRGEHGEEPFVPTAVRETFYGANGPIEPSGDSRGGASQIREWYVALRHEGFSDPQALSIVGQIMAISVANTSDDGGDS